MRIVRFTSGEDPQFGVLTGDVDEHGIPDEGCKVVALTGDPLYVGLHLGAKEYPLEDVRLLAPILPRSKVIGIGKNYAAHASEMGGEVPAEPLMFLKPNTSVVGPNDPIFYPRQSNEVHFEGELAVVIGRICRDVPKEKVGDVIWGYTVGNDVTARDLQRGDVQFTRAKGFDSFCPLGPWVETELDVSDLTVQTWLNGDLKQDGRTADMVFDVPTLVQHVSSVMTLLPGDVIWGYTVGNDVTARDLQRGDVQFTRAKGFDSFCPLGPWVETELDVSDLTVQTWLNGDLKQDGRTADMVFDVPTLVQHVSSVMTLLPGDVILTGTPEGVGPMEPGDEVEVFVSGIGSLTNKVVKRD